MTNSLIAITGGIGSGKSYVCSMLRRRGIEVYDCDSAAKRIIATSAEVRRGLTRLMGPHTFLADGRLNKAAVAEFLLQSESNAKAINDIVHPAVAADFKKSGVRWMECAILYESGFFRLALLFGKPFLFLNTCVAKPPEREYETGYTAMIRTEDITMIQAKPLTDQAKKVTE